MAGIHLLDGNDRDAPAGSLGDRPDAFDPRDPEFLQVGPDAGGTQSRPKQPGLVRRPVRHQSAGQGWIVAVTNALDPHEGRRPARPAVIAGELAERSFGEGLARIEGAFGPDSG